MSKEETTKSTVNWDDITCEIVRTAIFFQSFLKMSPKQQWVIVNILNSIKKPNPSPKPQEKRQ